MDKSLGITEHSRKHSLDTLKCLSCYLVIWIHSGFFGIHHTHVQWISFCSDICMALAQIAVPTFFIITGYYYCPEHQKRLSHIKKIALLTLGAFTLYLPWIIYCDFSEIASLDRDRLLQLLLFNETKHIFRLTYHLWYLLSLLYALTILYIIDHAGLWQKFKRNILHRLVITGFLISLLQADACYTRNFIFTAIPLISIGRILREKDDKGELSGIPAFRLICIFVIGLLISILEIRYQYESKAGIGAYAMSTAAVIYCLQNPAIGEQSIWARIGRCHSAAIYIAHILVVEMAWKISTGLIWDIPGLVPTTTFLITLFIVSALRKTGRRISQLRL